LTAFEVNAFREEAVTGGKVVSYVISLAVVPALPAGAGVLAAQPQLVPVARHVVGTVSHHRTKLSALLPG
jgi:hypothetical protein